MKDTQLGEVQFMKNSKEKFVVCFPFIGDYMGGSHLSALGLIHNLDRSRFTPLVVLHQPDGPVADIYRRERIYCEAAPAHAGLTRGRVRNGAAVASLARSVPELARFLTTKNVSIVHTNDGRTHVLWGLAARLAGAKHLWHHRSDASSFGLRHIAPWLCSRLVAVSKFASPRPGLFSAARKCSVIYSPFDVNKMMAIERQAARNEVLAEVGLGPETRLLGYVGTLVGRKRPILFVEAFAAFKRMRPEMKLAGLMIGNALNGLEGLVRSRAEELGVGEDIRLLGFRYPGEPWIAGIDALLVTAVDEPLGRTLVEAMLLGTPVVAADSGGNPEVIEDGETGLLVRPDDPDELAKACLLLFQDSSRSMHIVETARSKARARFSVELHVHAITSVYDELVGSRNRGREPTRCREAW